MSRSIALPYKPTNPRSIRGARKRGWHVIKVDLQSLRERTSWMGLNIWCDVACSGYWVSSFGLRELAFENSADATMFKLKWG
jgi:hypothetical protein